MKCEICNSELPKGLFAKVSFQVNDEYACKTETTCLCPTCHNYLRRAVSELKVYHNQKDRFNAN